MKLLLQALLLLATSALPADASDEQRLLYTFGFEELEYRANQGDDLVHYSLTGWVGGDRHKLRAAADGEIYAVGTSRGDLEFQLDYARLLSDFWDVHIGVREEVFYDSGSDVRRTQAVLGLSGVAPLWVEISSELFVSHDGETSTRLKFGHELQLTPNLVSGTDFEVNIAFQNAERFGVRSGFSELELGWRVRYEAWRYVIPYAGVVWRRLLADTADLARDEGDGVDEFGAAIGLRIIY